MDRIPCVSGSYKGFPVVEWNQPVLIANDHMFALKNDRSVIIDLGTGLRRKIKGRTHRLVPCAIRGAFPELELGRIRPVRTCSERDCVNPEHYAVSQIQKLRDKRKAELLSKAGA